MLSERQSKRHILLSENIGKVNFAQYGTITSGSICEQQTGETPEEIKTEKFPQIKTKSSHQDKQKH